MAKVKPELMVKNLETWSERLFEKEKRKEFSRKLKVAKARFLKY